MLLYMANFEWENFPGFHNFSLNHKSSPTNYLKPLYNLSYNLWPRQLTIRVHKQATAKAFLQNHFTL